MRMMMMMWRRAEGALIALISLPIKKERVSVAAFDGYFYPTAKPIPIINYTVTMTPSHICNAFFFL